VSRPATPRPHGIRRLERWLVGLAMAVVAFVLEKVVMRSVRKGGTAPIEPAGTTVTSRGGDVDLP
jgi:hypothetical protein